jgi:hypothetical protein
MRRWLLVLMLVAASVEAQGRPLGVRGRQPLAFGDLLGSVPRTVAWTDVGNAGHFEVRGRRFSQVLVSFLLPVELIGPGGATLPLAFGPGDAAYSAAGNPASAVPFDPSAPHTITLDNNGKGMIYFGGTVLPPGQAAIGAYSATVILIVSYVGI